MFPNLITATEIVPVHDMTYILVSVGLNAAAAAACTIIMHVCLISALMLHRWLMATSYPKNNVTDNIIVVHLAMIQKELVFKSYLKLAQLS